MSAAMTARNSGRVSIVSPSSPDAFNSTCVRIYSDFLTYRIDLNEYQTSDGERLPQIESRALL